MKKWITIIVVVLLIIIWRAFSIYFAAFDPVEKAEKRASKIAMEESNLETVTDTYTYYGTKAYHVVLGTTNKDEKIIVWVPDKKGEILSRKQSQGITEVEAIDIVRQDRNPIEIRSVKLGIEDDIPIWEIIFVDEDKRLTYYKVYFANGEFRNSIKP